MKKIILALVAFMLVLGMTQCKKEQPTPTPEPTPDGETVYISMKVDDGGAKHIVYPSTGIYVFESGDVIYVGNNGKYVGTLTYANGTFSGSITSPSTDDYLHFYFTGGKAPATAPTAGSTTSFTVDISDQSSKLPVLSYGHSTTKYIDGTTAYTCMLENQCGLVKFVPTIATSEAISVGGMKTIATINFASGNEGIAPVDATGAVKLYAASDSEKWAILLPQNEVENPTVIINHFIQTTIESVPVVTANLYYTHGVNIAMTAVPTGAVAGKFTINENGDQVYFSQGNLQYIGSASTPYWKFAEHQWDYLGTTTGQNSANQNVDRDLFGWGTSGWNNGNEYYMPYNTTNNGNSSSIGYGYGPTDGTNSYNLTGDYANADWGVYNAISNGGDMPGLWRTLTIAEWDYVLNSRSTPSGIRFVRAEVNGVNGLILLPDDWSVSVYALDQTSANNGAGFLKNVITAESWVTLESVGAVFLPCTGYRTLEMVRDSGSRGDYWSSSVYDNNNTNAWPLFFDSGMCLTNSSNSRTIGKSVRLVQDVE